VTVLLGVFAAVALAVTLAGIAGVVAFTVNQRTREIGIRMALGAQRSGVVRLLLRQGLALVVTGLLLGGASAWVLASWVSRLVPEVGGSDPAIFLLVAALLGGAAGLACLLPARRASRVDPVSAFRGG
jgi:putative ABC transport system permease protein